ncbi:MAG: acyl-CoA synthetase (AMP-forming)/AMP-acid ligase [Bradyrhizobium sp.]|nr:acyl-CoA synthetase (AMP-forming)/AMP-acid ligase [Bradyrhizobium sp.]
MSPAATYVLVGIEKTASVEYLEWIFDCYRDGRIAVPVDAGADAPEGYAFNERIVPAIGGGWFARQQTPNRSEAPAQISFSSGTTGTPKAILLSHRALADVTDRLIEAMGIDGQIREYLGVPPTYSFGLARARVVAAVGGQLYVPHNGFDPTELARMLEAGEVNALSAVPTLLRVLIANPELIGRKAARKLRWLEIGSQPMSAEDKHTIRRMFPGARIVQHYGLTEASRTTFLDLQEASDEDLASVGKPAGATQVRVDPDGHICIRGPHVADGILTPQGVSAIVDADGWLRTNDLGRIDERGFVHFLGRADSLLNVGGVKVPAELFEERLLASAGVDPAHLAVTGRVDPLRGEIVLIAHLAQVEPAPLLAHARAVGAGFGLGHADVTVIHVDTIPRTETGKVRRAELVEHAPTAAMPIPATASGSAPDSDAADTGFRSDRECEIAAIWREALGVVEVSRTDTFFDMGGDSLSAITVMLRMERAGISKEISQQIFEGRSIAQIAGAEDRDDDDAAPRSRRSARAEVSDAITMARGIMVLLVVGGHWGPFVLQRMGDLSGPLIHWTIPLFHLGTPGFAMIFGIGMAFFNMGMVKKHAERLRANTRTNLLILAGGVGTLAAVRAVALALEDPRAITVSGLFYGVLMAYLLLVAASGTLLRFIAARHHPVLAALILALTSLTLASVASGLWGGAETSGVFDLARLLLFAKYGFAQMLGYVAVGMTIGLWIEQAHDSDKLPAQAALSGVALLLGSALLTVGLGLQESWFGSAEIQMNIAYCGIVMLLFAIMLRTIRHGYADGAFKIPLRILMMIGILAFVFYVGHEVAMSVVTILTASHLPYFIAIMLPVGVFAFGCAFSIKRLYKLYFG